MSEKPMDRNDGRTKYYCEKLKKNVWVLGYFGGSSVNIKALMDIAEQFAEETGVPTNTIFVTEIDSSMRFKYFKYITSSLDDQAPLIDSVRFKDIDSFLYA